MDDPVPPLDSCLRRNDKRAKQTQSFPRNPKGKYLVRKELWRIWRASGLSKTKPIARRTNRAKGRQGLGLFRTFVIPAEAGIQFAPHRLERAPAGKSLSQTKPFPGAGTARQSAYSPRERPVLSKFR
jgi:hypothetical protein